MPKKIFRVYPNPFIHIDHDGYPAGVCPCDMIEHVGMTTRSFVGASLDRKQTVVLEKLSQDELRYRDPRQQTRWEFNFSEPTILPITEYYRDRIRSGEILASDAETHLLSGNPGPFVSPKEAIAKWKVASLKRWAAETGSQEKPEFIDVLDTTIAALGSLQVVSEVSPLPPAPSKGGKSA